MRDGGGPAVISPSDVTLPPTASLNITDAVEVLLMSAR
jgi:hypothetical protein